MRAVPVLFFLLIFMFIGLTANGQEKKIQWYTYSQKYKSYVPTEKPGKTTSLFLPLKNTKERLIIEAPESATLFLGDKIVTDFSKKGRLTLSCDSLYNIYQADTVFLTIYNAVKPSVLKAYYAGGQKNAGLQISRVNINKRKSMDFYLVALVIIALIAGFINTIGYAQPFTTRGFMQLFYARSGEQTLYNNPFFSRESFQYYLVVSLTAGLLLIYHNMNPLEYLFGFTADTFVTRLISWILTSALVYFLFYIKYLLYSFLGNIYNLRTYAVLQNRDFMKICGVFSVYYLLVAIVDLFWYPVTFSVVYYLPALLLLLYLITVFGQLNKLYSHTKLHLFSYLCVSEIVSWVIISGILRN